MRIQFHVYGFADYIIVTLHNIEDVQEENVLLMKRLIEFFQKEKIFPVAKNLENGACSVIFEKKDAEKVTAFLASQLAADIEIEEAA